MNKYQEALNRVLKFVPSNFIWSDMDVVGTLQELVDKATPVRVVSKSFINLVDDSQGFHPLVIGHCPRCGWKDVNEINNYCSNCGQKIEWSKVK